ncbi:MAG: hypothetical protein ACLQO1_04060 [Steroidobacteraceae bacterium]
MRKLVPLALAVCLGTTAASISVPAEAGVAISVGIPLPGVVVAAPPVVAPWPYYYAGPRYYYPGYVRYGYGVPFGYRYGFRPGFGHHGYVHGHAWR